MSNPPNSFRDIDHLEDFMTTPSAQLEHDLAQLDGDLMILGVGGKMGPTLARLAKRAAPAKRIVGVARFSDPVVKEKLQSWGIECIGADLLERDAVEALPECRNIIFMAGRKFGSSDRQDLTWAMNTLAPALVAERFPKARQVVFSTGCVYPYVSILHGGASEQSEPEPPAGEYANSCLGRERLFEYFSRANGAEGRIIRLNYAIDMRYGVLHDVALKVLNEQSIDLTMGHVNVIWQGDANSMVLRALNHCTAPIGAINISGPETISIRFLAQEFARIFGKKAQFSNREAERVWLVNTRQAMALFGYPQVSLGQMIEWTADWLLRAMPSLNKPTAYAVRDGRY